MHLDLTAEAPSTPVLAIDIVAGVSQDLGIVLRQVHVRVRLAWIEATWMDELKRVQASLPFTLL